MDNLELFIQNGDTLYFPAVEEGITWETERKGSPGKLTFNVVYDKDIRFEAGNAVRLRINNTDVFYGFVFSKKFDNNRIITVTAYDQLRYLKNKDTVSYENKTASDLIKKLAADFNLQVGTIEDSEYIIASRIEKNQTLFDMIQTALDLTLQNKKRMYVLYDDFGKLTLKSIESMRLDLVVGAKTAENFSYQSSIEGSTYNKIKLSYPNENTGKEDIYITQDSNNMNTWGVLQYFDTIDEKTNGRAKADALLKLYNKKTKNLSISNAIGDLRVRGGSGLIIYLKDLEGVDILSYMLVERVKHTFKNNEHMMELTLRGGEFVV
ncbi:MAG: hydrolase [Clostridia bacterium]|nr:hydrolase [Clostridia bacterium]